MGRAIAYEVTGVLRFRERPQLAQRLTVINGQDPYHCISGLYLGLKFLSIPPATEENTLIWGPDYKA